MPELKSMLNGVGREKKILSYTVDLVSGKCSVKTQVALDWVSSGDSKCLSTSLEDIELSLADFPELVLGLEAIYKKLAQVDEVYVATKLVEISIEGVE